MVKGRASTAVYEWFYRKELRPSFPLSDPKNGRSFCQTEMSQPEDVSVSRDGNTIAVADTGNNRVRLYTIKGQQLSVIGKKAASPS